MAWLTPVRGRRESYICCHRHLPATTDPKWGVSAATAETELRGRFLLVLICSQLARTRALNYGCACYLRNTCAIIRSAVTAAGAAAIVLLRSAYYYQQQQQSNPTATATAWQACWRWQPAVGPSPSLLLWPPPFLAWQFYVVQYVYTTSRRPSLWSGVTAYYCVLRSMETQLLAADVASSIAIEK